MTMIIIYNFNEPIFSAILFIYPSLPVLLGFEPRLEDSKSSVLPLHHKTFFFTK